jgi:SET domain
MNRKETIRRILRECYCRLAPSPIHGVGVFAVRDIPKGIDPFAIGIGYPQRWVTITPEELERAPRGVRGVFASLFLPEADASFRIPILGANLVDIGAYLNHSSRPNMRTADGHGFITKRRIRAGKELTVDYATYGAGDLLA